MRAIFIDNKLTITLPLPAKELSPNARGHWAKKARAVKQTREMVCALCMQAIGRRKKPQWSVATTQATFTFKTKRRRDKDNLAASLKAHWDGLVDAGLLTDDVGLTHLPIIIQYGEQNVLELTITREL